MNELSHDKPANRSLLLVLGAVRLVIVVCLIGGLLFWGAGTADWVRGWVFLALMGATFALNMSLMIAKDPESMQQRWKQRSDTKPFDKVFGLFYALATIAMLGLAGMDAVRFEWTSMPPGLLYAGVALHFVGLIPVLWSLLANPHLETSVRIQNDRNHQVITSGPYRYVRHPMYTGIMLLYLGWSFILQSWVAFAIACFIVLLLIIRTRLEDATLQNELQGYSAFCQQTRYRLIPHVW